MWVEYEELAVALRRQQRRAIQGRQQVIPDFLIGAHAMVSADALITRDCGFLRDYFRSLKIIDPSK